MSKKLKSGSGTAKVSYVLKPSRPGQAAFSDVHLPNGTIIRRVDEDVHRRALSNAAKSFREKA